MAASTFKAPWVDRIFRLDDPQSISIQLDSSAGITYCNDDFILVNVDGACRGSGTPTATSSYGIFFAPNSPYNMCALLPANEVQTNQAAGLFAVREAIKSVVTNKIKPFEYWDGIDSSAKVVIQTDSLYIFTALTDYIWTWQSKGYLSSSGRQILNVNLIIDIHRLTYEAEWNHDIRIRFRLVGREDNSAADRLANIALDKPELYHFAYERPCLPNKVWRRNGKYGVKNTKELKFINRVLGRLEYPLPASSRRENIWMSSVLSWTIRHLLLYGRKTGVGERAPNETLPELFERILGLSWPETLRHERSLIENSIKKFNHSLKLLEVGSVSSGHPKWISYHEQLAGFGRMTACINTVLGH
ncbi:hypothetical protein HYFRA_00012140 [Hymenoscyphus fraxineus]|uniref:ribonuclease H n=1 Tax=Hymenoscyphus fraxineus TaxID=746836 RepID=A0A9N9L7K2_9HELO|nr:hypothetical protein HYFRA_00012140 [Hymenoscyphus fraxineus]